MNNLFQASIDIILQNQDPSGAYLACPNFPTYRYCWYRDGAFIAYAMDLVGEYNSAARFHDWAAVNINKRADVVEKALEKARRGEALSSSEILHTRYTVAGEPADEDWPNFQLDGFGTWLWALGEHVRLSQIELPQEWLSAANLVAGYLAALWDRPCYDCWEEFPDQVHPYTLAAIYGGLRAHEVLAASDHQSVLKEIQAFIFEHYVVDGHFVKFKGEAPVDSSLLGLSMPYGLVAPDDSRMMATVGQIEKSLQAGGGLHRYARDSYYGGGEWLLLTAWLGWYYAELGEGAKRDSNLAWVEGQVGENGNLPEQVPHSLIKPDYYDVWVKRWGEIATPLLWSHANYIILCKASD